MTSQSSLRILIDTNRYSDLDRGDRDVISFCESADEVWMPFVALGELKVGFLIGGQPEANEANLQAFLGKPSVGVLLADASTSDHYANVVQALRSRGTPIPTNDMWIAALALQHGLTLFSRDKHFQSVPGLQLL